MFSSIDADRSRRHESVFGQSQSVVLGNRQDFFGGELGYDTGGTGGGRGVLFGIMGGFTSFTLAFMTSVDRLAFDAVNAGAYAGWRGGPLFVNVLGKYAHN